MLTGIVRLGVEGLDTPVMADIVCTSAVSTGGGVVASAAKGDGREVLTGREARDQLLALPLLLTRMFTSAVRFDSAMLTSESISGEP